MTEGLKMFLAFAGGLAILVLVASFFAGALGNPGAGTGYADSDCVRYSSRADDLCY